MLFIVVLLIVYYFNLAGRIHGLFTNYIVTGVLNFAATYYLLKFNPFRKVGLALIFLPFMLLTGTVIYGLISNQVMPGIIGYLMYVFSTFAGIILYRASGKSKVVVLYAVFLALAFSNYYNLLNLYYSIARSNEIVGDMLPEIWVADNDGKVSRLTNNNKVLVLDLWSNSCSNCITAFPKFEKVKNDYRNDHSVDFLAINIYHNMRDIRAAQKYLEGFTFKNYFSDETLFQKLNFAAVPYYVVVGRDNRIKYFGNLNMETYETYNNIYTLIDKEK